MKNKLFQLLIIFLTSWTAGQVCHATYSQNLVFTIFAVIAGMIWLGFFSNLKASRLKK